MVLQLASGLGSVDVRNIANQSLMGRKLRKLIVNPDLETHLQSKLHRAWTMSVDWVKEGSTGNAIRSTNSLESRGVVGSGIATNYVISEAAGVIQIEDAELRVVEDVKGLGAKLHTDAF